MQSSVDTQLTPVSCPLQPVGTMRHEEPFHRSAKVRSGYPS
ncbi:MAG: hypothetical protein ACLPQS_15360 [Acidimicrobiales bacterium]